MCVRNKNPEQINRLLRFYVLLMGILITTNKSVLSFSDGVPLSVCSDLESIHGVEPQPPPYPYYTYPNKQEVTHGDSIQLTLSVRLRVFGSFTFKGYLLVAINNESKPIGTFLEPSNGQIITCPNGANSDNAVTHQWSDEKQFVQVRWIPPEDYTGIVYFKTTYMQNGTIFWVSIPATNPVRVKTPPTTTSLSTPPTSTKIVQTLPVTQPDDDENDLTISTGAKSSTTTEEDSDLSTITELPTSELLLTTTKLPSNASLFKTRLDILVLVSLACYLAVAGPRP